MEIAMSHFFYKTTAAAIAASCIDWAANRAAWDERRNRLGEVFSGAASSMYSRTTVEILAREYDAVLRDLKGEKQSYLTLLFHFTSLPLDTMDAEGGACSRGLALYSSFVVPTNIPLDVEPRLFQLLSKKVLHLIG